MSRLAPTARSAMPFSVLMKAKTGRARWRRPRREPRSCRTGSSLRPGYTRSKIVSIGEERDVGAAHHPQIDAVEHGDDDDAGEQRRDAEPERDHRDGAAGDETSRDARPPSRQRPVIHRQQRAADAAAEREGPFAGQIGEVEQPERDHHGERHEGVDQALRQGDGDELDEAADDVHGRRSPQLASSTRSSFSRKRATRSSTEDARLSPGATATAGYVPGPSSPADRRRRWRGACCASPSRW